VILFLQVGSHFPFLEVNPRLSFDRRRAYGKHLDIPAGTSLPLPSPYFSPASVRSYLIQLCLDVGTAVRFEPGESKSVTLVAVGGNRIIRGGSNLGSGLVDESEERWEELLRTLRASGFNHVEEPGALAIKEDRVVSRETCESDDLLSFLLQRRWLTRCKRVVDASMYGPTAGDRVRCFLDFLLIMCES
jgi:urease